MSRAFDQSVAKLRARRTALRTTAADFRTRFTAMQLAEDALSLVDPELSFLGRVKERVQHNRLLSLAILAGAGWLVGSPRHQEGEPPVASPRANMKENNNDSGQIHGEHWSGTGSGHAQERREKGSPDEAGSAQQNRKAGQDSAGTPLHVQPRRQPGGERRQVEASQQVEDRP